MQSKCRMTSASGRTQIPSRGRETDRGGDRELRETDRGREGGRQTDRGGDRELRETEAGREGERQTDRQTEGR